MPVLVFKISDRRVKLAPQVDLGCNRKFRANETMKSPLPDPDQTENTHHAPPERVGERRELGTIRVLLRQVHEKRGDDET